MNDFIDIIQDRLEDKKSKRKVLDLSFEEKLEKLPVSLHRTARQLQLLVDSKAMLENGSLFQYDVAINEGAYYILLNFPGLDTHLSYGSNGTIYLYQLDERGLSDQAMVSYLTEKTEEKFLRKLAHYLGSRLGNLGLLDKQIYSKDTQDHLGI
jgi:hypothetical protein